MRGCTKQCNSRALLFVLLVAFKSSIAAMTEEKDASSEAPEFDADGWTADGLHRLHFAASETNTDALKALLGSGVDVNLVGKECSSSALHSAAREGNEPAAKMLLERKASIDAQDGGQRTALVWAAQNGHLELVKYLLDARANIDGAADSGITPLSSAAGWGKDAVVKELLTRKASLAVKDKKGLTVLDKAKQWKKPAILELLNAAAAQQSSVAASS